MSQFTDSRGLPVSGNDQAAVDAYLEKQQKFDPDLWIIETESGTGDPSISVVDL